MLYIDPKLVITRALNPAKDSSLGMMHRRHFLRAVPMLPLWGLLALSVPADMTLAQQMSGKPEVKISELRPIVEEYVNQLSQLSKEHTGVEFSPKEKQQMIEETIFTMKAEGFYAYVDP